MKNVRYPNKKFYEVEVFIMVITLWWGFTLLLPLNTFNTSPSYHGIRGIAGEAFWSINFIVIGLIQLIGMLRDDKSIKKIGLILSMGIWLCVAASIFMSTQASISASGTYLCIAALCGWLHVKVGEQE